MGKMALLVVVGLTISLRFLTNTLLQRTFETMDIVNNYYGKVMVKNIAHSAMNYYLKQLYLNKSLRGTFPEKNKYAEGSIDTVRITADSATTSVGDTVHVRVVAHYGGESSSMEVALLGASLFIPPVNSGLGFPDANPEIDMNGNPQINGDNHDKNGNPDGSCPDLPGIAVSSGSDSVGIVGDIGSKPGFVKGLGADPSVHVRDTVDPSTYINPIISNADCTLTSGTYDTAQYGSESSPAVVYGKGDLKFTGGIVGHGILVIDGTLSLAGNFIWYGLVIVTGSNAEIYNAVGTSKIRGGVIIGGNSIKARIRGSADIKYSCKVIENIRNNTNSLVTFSMLSWYE